MNINGSTPQDTPHQESGSLKTRLANSIPDAAGLKIWRFFILKKFFKNMAKIAAITTGRKDEAGEIKRAIIKPDTMVADGKNKVILRILRNITSATTVVPTAKNKFCKTDNGLNCKKDNKKIIAKVVARKFLGTNNLLIYQFL